VSAVWWQRREKRNINPGWVQAEPVSMTRAPGFSESVARAAEFIGDGGTVRHPVAAGSGDTALVEARAFVSEGPQGHRERMRDRLLDRGPDSLADYELLEMLLFFAQPKGDTKPVAKRLINHFGSYANALAAPPDDLEKVRGIGRTTAAALKLVHGAALRLARAELKDLPVLGNWEQLLVYLNAVMAREKVEQFRILFLDTKNRLIADELQGKGTINHTPVYPREVARRALELHAAALILAHNHPSGDPTPSVADLDMTMEMQRMLKSLGIALHDHIIVGNGRWTSLQKEGFL
jgi:DNA repair protein RadC